MKKKTKEIVFDFDGVIVNTTSFCVNEMQNIGEHITGKRLDSETILAEWGGTLEDLIQRLYPGVSLNTYLETRCLLGLDDKLPPEVVGARRSIEVLSRSYPLSTVTNRERMTLEKVIDGLNIDRDRFKFIQSCTDTDFHKPNPRVFERYWETVVDISPEQVLYVGDHLVDHQAASSRGFGFVGVLSGGITTRQDFLDAGVEKDSILESVVELPKYLGLE